MAPAAALFARGLALHQRGELAQAGALYRQVLQAEPRHVDALPRALRALLGVIGARGEAGGLLASYLLFEAPYTREMMAAGRAETAARAAEITALLKGATATD